MEILLQQQDKFFDVTLLIVASIFFRLLLQTMGQRWIVTVAHTSTLVFLPILTYVITSVISGNIALSLGMVGALSIVRFRNPVRSPLELSVYFGAITMGITASVSTQWLFLLIFSILFATIVLAILHRISLAVIKKPLFVASFSEGNSLSTLNLQASKNIIELDDNHLLTMKSVTKSGINYVLASGNFTQILALEDIIKENPDVVEYQVSK
jgi:hypothetical protein